MSRVSELILSFVLTCLLCSVALAVPGGPQAVIYNSDRVKALKAGILLFDQSSILSGTADPTSSATSAAAGSLYLNSSSGTVYLKTDAGSSTNWVPQLATTGVALSNSDDIKNCTVVGTVAGNALTYALKTASGANPSATSPCTISYRNATAATATFTAVTTTAAVSVVISDGSALGCTASVACTHYIYAIYTGSATVLGVVGGVTFDEGTPKTSTVLAGSGGDDAYGTLYSTAAQTTKPIRLLARATVTPGASFVWDAAPTEHSNFPFKTKAWFVSATLSGANPDLGVSAVTAYTEIINASLTLTPKSGSAPAGTMCSTTNAATAPVTTATVCAAGSESVGISFVPPETGQYEVCVYGGQHHEVDQNERLTTTWQLIHTPTNAQTLTTLGESTVTTECSGLAIATGTGAYCGSSISHCSLFAFSGGTAVGVRLMFEQSAFGTGNSSTLFADADTSNGQRVVNFTVKRL